MAYGGLRLAPHVDAEDDDDLWVYAVRNKRDTLDPVKFGVTDNFERRFRALQTGHPYPLAKLAFVPGGKALEKAIHRLLAPWRTSGEWFGCDDCYFTRFAKHLKEEDFRAAVLRWDRFDDHFKSWARAMIGATDDAKWLEYFCDHLGSNFCCLMNFIDRCGEVSRADGAEGGSHAG